MNDGDRSTISGDRGMVNSDQLPRDADPEQQRERGARDREDAAALRTDDADDLAPAEPANVTSVSGAAFSDDAGRD